MPRERLSTMDVDTCLELLASKHLGRLALNDDGGPVVLPVNYVVDQGSVLFRTDEGTKLAAAQTMDAATFQADHVDEVHRLGWSVMVRGRVTEVVDPEELDRVRQLPLHPFVGGERPRYVRLLSASMTGRRIALPEGIPDGWFVPGDLGNRWFGQDADDLGL